MPGELPFLRGRIEKSEAFTSARGGGGDRPRLPPRDPTQHRAALLTQMDQLVADARGRPAGSRDEEASREIIAIVPEPGAELAAPSFADAATGVRLVGSDPDSGVVIIDAPTPELPALRRKLDEFADTSKLTPGGHPRHEPLLAPVRELRRAALADVGAPSLLTLPVDAAHWIEIGCAGGIYEQAGTARSRRQIERQLARVAPTARIVAQFTATSQVVFYAKLNLTQLRALLEATDCIYEVFPSEPKIRDWLLHEHDEVDLAKHVLSPPPKDAAVVVLLDSGIAATHPLLASAVLSADSVVPGVTSGIDIDGHGTEMAGVALHSDGVGAIVQLGQGNAPHWLQSVKVITSDSSSSDESARSTWAPMTVEAIGKAEAVAGVRNRAFVMAVTADLDPLVPTTWSQAIDQLAYNDGKGRLVCISAGNADSGNVDILTGYPQLNLVQSIQDPAQAWNALTVGAYTARDQMPNDDSFRTYAPIAPAGGISPHSSSRPLGAVRVPNKPEIVFEGGNVAFDGELPDPTVGTLTALTTGHRPNRPLSAIWATSEAAARAGNLSAAIWTADPALRPATVRGLQVHSASWTEKMEEQFESLDDRLRICGYGVPDPAMAISCARERATVVIEDVMPNAVIVDRPRKEPPRRAGVSPTERVAEHIAKFFRLPIEDQRLLEHPHDVELRVTLSYFAEIQTYRRRAFRGLDLRWDMQGPQEAEDAFRWRVNKRVREQTADKHKGKSFKWDVGPERRENGTVQSDRWSGPASFLAGSKLIAVMPVLGWWNQYVGFRTKELPFSLIVTIRSPGLDIYSMVEVALAPAIEVRV